MELEVGMYVRTKWGDIGKVWLISENCTETFDFDLDNEKTYLDCEIKKSSYNIIDLIEVGDYVNGYKVMFNKNNCIMLSNGEIIREEKCIKSILTREQYEANCYKIGE